ncbi:hypothetical protein OGAPHI_002472 [Ogataea philodendri]|uniref:Uncharacterized protein n=1 Tax=Ogataea philodendri TaxID=1378263 RepID=A0A9P8T730_9ASCO|nr:uncharacterized protein OGAPHI_002472 [Ogataea philodendri]KAH3668718.1 hypothetical protein OGAPHI_002472 [Ogataea philodendri]
MNSSSFSLNLLDLAPWFKSSSRSPRLESVGKHGSGIGPAITSVTSPSWPFEITATREILGSTECWMLIRNSHSDKHPSGSWNDRACLALTEPEPEYNEETDGEWLILGDVSDVPGGFESGRPLRISGGSCNEALPILEVRLFTFWSLVTRVVPAVASDSIEGALYGPSKLAIDLELAMSAKLDIDGGSIGNPLAFAS